MAGSTLKSAKAQADSVAAHTSKKHSSQQHVSEKHTGNDAGGARTAGMKTAGEHELSATDIAEERKENIIAISIVFLLLALAGWWVYANLYHSVAPVERVPVTVGGAPVLGLDAAPITVIMYSDFECPYCGEFSREQFPLIKQQYIDTGKVRFAFRQFPLTQAHPHAELAAAASLCAHEQQKFWEYHDILYAHQDKLAREDLIAYANAAALNIDNFKSCLDSPSLIQQVMAEKNDGMKFGVSGTPTFFFNGRRVVGALSVEEFGKEVAAETK